jgi:hypothetical protein
MEVSNAIQQRQRSPLISVLTLSACICSELQVNKGLNGCKCTEHSLTVAVFSRVISTRSVSGEMGGD